MHYLCLALVRWTGRGRSGVWLWSFRGAAVTMGRSMRCCVYVGTWGLYLQCPQVPSRMTSSSLVSQAHVRQRSQWAGAVCVVRDGAFDLQPRRQQRQQRIFVRVDLRQWKRAMRPYLFKLHADSRANTRAADARGGARVTRWRMLRREWHELHLYGFHRVVLWRLHWHHSARTVCVHWRY